MIDVRAFSVGPIQENAYIVRASPQATQALMIDPGDESQRLLDAAAALGVEIEAILITHCHFDHIGAVAPVAKATAAPVYCPEIETGVLADITKWTMPGFGPFESWQAENTVKGAERLRLADMDIEVVFTPGHSPGHVTYAIDGALLSGDVLFQGSVGRVDLPGGDWATLERSIGGLMERFERDTVVYPGHMGVTTLGREWDANPFLSELRAATMVPVPAHQEGLPQAQDSSQARGTQNPEGTRRGARKLSGERIKAPRGTFDVLGEQAAIRMALEDRARSILEGAGYERIETPAFEATELFARGVGSSTDIVQKEMYTLIDAGGRSLTLRPEGTAPVCRAYVEHGMHKRAQPVKLWYLSSFFRHERAQSGRYRQFWQVGAEALGSEDPAVDAESILLLATLLEELGVREVRLRLSSLGGSSTRERYRERLQAYLRAHAESLSAEVRERIELNPLRAFDSAHEGTIAVMRRAPRLLDELDAEDVEHFATVRALLDRAGLAYVLDSTLVRGLDYYTRTVFEFTSDALGAQSGVGGGGRYDGLVRQLGGPATPGMGWAAGIERILLAGSAPPAGGHALDLYVGLSDLGQDGSRSGGAKVAAFGVLSEARSAGLRAVMEMAGRSLKGQLGQANRLGARYIALVGDGETVLKDMQGGGQETLETDKVVHAALRGLRELA